MYKKNRKLAKDRALRGSVMAGKPRSMVVRRSLTDYTRAPRDMTVNLHYVYTAYALTIPNGFASVIDKL